MEIQKRLIQLISSYCNRDGINETQLEGVLCLRSSRSRPPKKSEWPESFVLVAQGKKKIRVLGESQFFSEAHYLATPISLMVESQLKVVAPDKPYLALMIRLDLRLLAEIVSQMDQNQFSQTAVSTLGIYFGRASERLLEAACRLLEALKNPIENRVLINSALCEIYFHILREPGGDQIQQLALAKSEARKISLAVSQLKLNFQSQICIDDLAKSANMSRTTFFRLFKRHTKYSPVQFLKAIRLIEARRLLQTGEAAAQVAYKVGYKSPSQFSREYSRHFGETPGAVGK